MNLSRAYALAYDVKDLSVGRVQTPTLAMVVERELAIRNFVPEDYREVQATFHPTGTPARNTYQGTWFRDRPPTGEHAPAGGRRGGRADRRTRARPARQPSSRSKRRRSACRRQRSTI